MISDLEAALQQRVNAIIQYWTCDDYQILPIGRGALRAVFSGVYAGSTLLKGARYQVAWTIENNTGGVFMNGVAGDIGDAVEQVIYAARELVKRLARELGGGEA